MRPAAYSGRLKKFGRKEVSDAFIGGVTGGVSLYDQRQDHDHKCHGTCQKGIAPMKCGTEKQKSKQTIYDGGNSLECLGRHTDDLYQFASFFGIFHQINGGKNSKRYCDPFRVMDIFLKQLKEQGFNGVQNFPTVGLIDGKFRANLEETGMGYGLEVDMIREAHKLDMLTCPYVFDPEQAKAMAEAGADILVAHMGLTTKGSIGAETALTLDDCCVKIREIIKAGREVNPDILVICHGGPIADPEDAAYVIKNVPEIDGFFGASSIERLASERGMTAQAAAFKAIEK